jgi:hypothetical protein
MDLFVAQKNVDHYLELLDSPDLVDSARDTVRHLLKEETERLHPIPSTLIFLQSRIVGYQTRATDIQRVRDSLSLGSTDWEKTADVLNNLRNTLNLLWKTCQRLRIEIDRNPV